MMTTLEMSVSSFAQKRVLLVDDDERLERLVKRLLEKELFQVETLRTGSALLQSVRTNPPSLIILDVNLPDGNGMDLIAKIRQICHCGIILLTGRQEPIDRVLGLELGADDYVCKPFDNRELIARVKSVLRRLDENRSAVAPEESEPHHIYHFGSWSLDIESQELKHSDGRIVPLTHYEFIVLQYFLRHPNRVVSRDQLLQMLSGRTFESFDRSVDVLIGKIRKKIEDDPKNPSFIHTVRGSGYKFVR